MPKRAKKKYLYFSEDFLNISSMGVSYTYIIAIALFFFLMFVYFLPLLAQVNPYALHSAPPTVRP